MKKTDQKKKDPKRVEAAKRAWETIRKKKAEKEVKSKKKAQAPSNSNSSQN